MRYVRIRFFEGRQKLLDDGVVFSANIAFLHMWSGGPLRGLVLLLKWSNILVFFCLVFYCIILFCQFVSLFVLCFYRYFCNRSFWKILWTRLSWVMLLYNALVLGTHCACSSLKPDGDYAKTSFPCCFGLEYIWSVCEGTCWI